MKKVLLLTAFSVLVLCANNSFAASKSETATVTATIVGAGSVTKSQDMNFGTIVSSPQAQTAKLDPNGNLSGVTSARGDATKAAEFTIAGDTGMAYTIDVADTTLSNGANTMVLNNFTLLVDDSAYSQSQQKITDGSDVVKVGADLNIKANQPSGVYTGEITLTMSY
ncbi:MAG: DUF4402 domain-containing protein [Alphaproteobacteria bacterium]|nr:DUF4402 domain-containing protein [Alphaproteobacteria bacterium]